MSEKNIRHLEGKLIMTNVQLLTSNKYLSKKDVVTSWNFFDPRSSPKPKLFEQLLNVNQQLNVKRKRRSRKKVTWFQN